MIKKVELDFHGRPLSIEVGKVAKQADGAALVRYGETVVLVTAVAAKDLKTEGKFPAASSSVRAARRKRRSLPVD
jgi:polyribonucleotide nucleotidyltransferase